MENTKQPSYFKTSQISQWLSENVQGKLQTIGAYVFLSSKPGRKAPPFSFSLLLFLGPQNSISLHLAFGFFCLYLDNQETIRERDFSYQFLLLHFLAFLPRHTNLSSLWTSKIQIFTNAIYSFSVYMYFVIHLLNKSLPEHLLYLKLFCATNVTSKLTASTFPTNAIENPLAKALLLILFDYWWL